MFASAAPRPSLRVPVVIAIWAVFITLTTVLVRAEQPLARTLVVVGALKERLNLVRDYTCTCVITERANEDYKAQQILVQIRRQEVKENGQVNPRLARLTFVRREGVETLDLLLRGNKNPDKYVLRKIIDGQEEVTVLRPLDPQVVLASRVSYRYVGLDEVLERFEDRCLRELDFDNVATKMLETNVNGRRCWMKEIIHTQRRKEFDCYKIKFIHDAEMAVPLELAEYDWPKQVTDPPPLIRSFVFSQIKLHASLPDNIFE